LRPKRTDGSSGDFVGLDVEDENAVEQVLGVENITLADLGVRGMSFSPLAAAPDEEGMTNFSGRK
jgi:hypothetical protein